MDELFKQRCRGIVIEQQTKIEKQIIELEAKLQTDPECQIKFANFINHCFNQTFETMGNVIVINYAACDLRYTNIIIGTVLLRYFQRILPEFEWEMATRNFLDEENKKNTLSCLVWHKK
jgi:hypothetical protein